MYKDYRHLEMYSDKSTFKLGYNNNKKRIYFSEFPSVDMGRFDADERFEAKDMVGIMEDRPLSAFGPPFDCNAFPTVKLLLLAPFASGSENMGI